MNRVANREKRSDGLTLRLRRAVLNGEWIQDGLRHGFATYYNALTKNPYKVCYVTGDIIKTVQRHYMRAVKKSVCDAFWGLTPNVVLADEQGDPTCSAVPSENPPEQKQSNVQGVWVTCSIRCLWAVGPQMYWHEEATTRTRDDERRSQEFLTSVSSFYLACRMVCSLFLS